MKFSIQKSDLIKHIQYLYNIIPGKNAMPILMNYIIEANEDSGNLKLVASNLELTVISEFPAKIVEGGKVAILAKKFNDIVNSFSDGKIDCFTEDGKFHISSRSSKFHLLMADASSFPLIPSINPDNLREFDAISYKKMIEKTVFAASTDFNKPIYTGVYWELNPENQIMAATDGKKLSRVIYSNKMGIEEQMKFVVPAKTLQFIQKIIEKSPTIKIFLNNSRLIYVYENYTIISNLINGKYPKYSRVIPEDTTNTLVVDKEELLNVVRRTSLLANDVTYLIMLKVSSEEFVVSSEDEEEGDATDFITDYTYQGDEMLLPFNFRYLITVLSAIETEKVLIKIKKKKVPVLFFDYENKSNDIDALYLLMPLTMRT